MPKDEITLNFKCSHEVKNFFAATGGDLKSLVINDNKCGDSFNVIPGQYAGVAFIIPQGTGSITIYARKAGLTSGAIAFIVIGLLATVGIIGGIYFYNKRKNA